MGADAVSLTDGVDQGMSTTLEDLLEDDTFGADSICPIGADNGDWQFQECLTTFVEGNSENCLEKMYEYGWFDSDVLQKNEPALNLFLNAFEGTTSFSELSAQVKTSVRSILIGTVEDVSRGTDKASIAEDIWICSKYFKCCSKLYSSDEASFGRNSNNLCTMVRRSILGFSRQISKEKNYDMVHGLRQLVETYIFEVQIGLLGMKPSVSLYCELCADAPNISDLFKTSTDFHVGKSFEELILGRLDMKQSHKTMDARKNRLSHQEQDHVSSLPVAHEPSPYGRPKDKNEPVVEKLPNTQMQVFSKFTHKVLRYLNRGHFSGQTMLIVFLILLMSLKRLSNLRKLPIYLTRTFKKALPQVSALFKLLSSI